jgi:hypothetical protein
MCQDLHILMVIGLAAPIDIGDLRAGLEATLGAAPPFLQPPSMCHTVTIILVSFVIFLLLL